MDTSGQPPLREQLGHRGRLARADLHGQERDAARRHDQPADDVEAVLAAEQRLARLVPDVARQHLARRDVGRVGDDGVERAGDRLEQVALQHLHVEPEPGGVGPRHRERARAELRGHHVEVGALGLERQRDRPRARADVGHARAARQVERGLDDVLGLRARDEHARVDGQVDGAEALAAEQVGDGLALAAARGQVHERARLVGLEPALGIDDQRGAVDPQHVREQQLGVEPRRLAAGRAQSDDGGVERVADARAREQPPGHQAEAASSRARFSASCSAAVCSSSSPPSTCSRLWTVSLERWSVTRPCGKL